MSLGRYSSYGRGREGLYIALVAATACAGAGLYLWSGDGVLTMIIATAPLATLAMIRFPAIIAIAFFSQSSLRLTEGFQDLHGLSIPLVLGVLTLGAIGYHALARRGLAANAPRQVQLMVVFFVVMSIGVPFAVLPDRAIDLWSDGFLKSVIVGVALFLLVHTRDDIVRLFWGTLIPGAALAPLVIFNKWAGIGLVEGTRAVISPDLDSILADPNFSAQILLLPFCLAIGLLESPGRPWHRVLGAAIAAMTMVGIVATQSRGALIGILIVFAVYVGRHLKSRALSLALICAVALLLASAMGISSRSSGGTASIAEDGLDDSAAHRLIAWQAAIGMAQSRPLTGIGMNGFRQMFFAYTPTWIGRSMDVHSTWFLVLAEGGVIAFGLYISVMALTLRSFAQSVHSARPAASSRRPPDPMLFAATLGFFAATVSFVTTGTFITNPYSAIPIGLVAISAIVARCVVAPTSSTQLAWPSFGPRQRSMSPTLFASGT